MTDALQSIRTQLVELLPRLRRFARTLTQHHADADDLLQVAVERALLRHEQWDPRSRLDSWMFAIIRNAWIDEIRQRQRRGVHIDVDAVPESDMHTHSDATVAGLSVHQALARLAEDQRLAVTLVLVEGLSYKEAAGILDVPVGTLTSRLARGREILQGLLETDGVRT